MSSDGARCDVALRRRPGRRAVRRHRPGGGAAEHDDPAHRQRELHLAGGAPGHRLRAHQQVRRGLPGQALLRRQPHRRVGGPRHRAGQGALRRRARQRAAPLRRQREHGRLPGAAGARRHDPRAVTRPRRAPHARLTGQRQRAALPLRVLQAQPERRTHRPRPGAGPRRRAPPADDRCRCNGLSAPHRGRAVPGDRRRGRRAADVRHRAHRRADRRRRAPSPVGIADVVTFTTHKTLRVRVGERSRATPSSDRASTRRSSPGSRAARSST